MKEKDLSQAEKEDKMFDYACKFALGSTVFATLIGVALTVFMVCLIVNK